jgi:hypothetical protein
LCKSINLNKELSHRIQPFKFGFSDYDKSLELSIPDVSQHERYDPKNDINCDLYSVHGKGKKKIKGKFITLDSFIKMFLP